MLVPSAPFLLSRRRDSLPGLWLGPACAGRVGGERGSSVPRGILSTTCSDGVHSAASYPWAGAVTPSWGWGGQGRIRMSALVYVKLGVALTVAGPDFLKCPLCLGGDKTVIKNMPLRGV